MFKTVTVTAVCYLITVLLDKGQFPILPTLLLLTAVSRSNAKLHRGHLAGWTVKVMAAAASHS